LPFARTLSIPILAAYPFDGIIARVRFHARQHGSHQLRRIAISFGAESNIAEFGNATGSALRAPPKEKGAGEVAP
jgi:hypothetical protein